MLETKFVVDTSVLAAWLLKPRGLTGKIVRCLELELYTPYKAVEELWEHESEWSTKNPSIDLREFISGLEYYVKIQGSESFANYRREAGEIMRSIDSEDSEFVALALFHDSAIWSYDPDFRRQSRVKVVGSDYILRNSISIPTLWEALKDEYKI